MKLFYVMATRDTVTNGHVKVVLTEEVESEYDSSCIEIDLCFTDKPDFDYHKNKLALFTANEMEILMAIKNKTIPWGSDLKIKGRSVRSFDTLFGYVENVEIKEITIDI